MRLTAVARRYAGALFGAARQAEVIDLVESDLGLITYSLQTMPRLKEALEHPLIPAERKKEIVADVLKGEVQEVTLHFLSLVIDKRREDILDGVEQEYVRLANESRGVVTAVVTSAVPLTPSERNELRGKLGEFTGKNVELDVAEDPTLIGGLVVRIGDTVLDGSVRGYLALLRSQLLGE